MKKLLKYLSLVLLLVCAFSFVACGEKPTETTNGVEEAKQLVKAMYSSDENHTSSYTVVSVVRVDGVSYNVTWSVKINSGSEANVSVVAPETVGGDYTIKYAEEISEDTAYILTATVSDANGNTASVSFRERVAKALGATSASAFAQLKDGVAVKAKGVVVNIIYKGYYILDNTGMILVYNPSSFPELGQTVEVKGEKGSYSGAHQFKAATSSFTVDEAAGVKSQAEINALLNAQTMSVADATAIDKISNINKVVTITGILAANGSYNYDVTDDGKTVTLANINNDYSSQLKEALGKKVTLTCSVYSSSQWTYVINSISAAEMSDAESVAAAKEEVAAKASSYDGFSALATEVFGCAVSYAETTDPATGLVAADGSVKTPANDTVVKLTATITKGEVSETVAIEITVKAIEVMSISDACSKADDAAIKVKGVVINIIYNAYYVADESGIMMVYRPSSYPTLGQTVTVTGTKGTYNSAHQFAAGSSLVVDEASAVKTAEEIAAIINASEVSDIATVVAGEESINKAFTIKGVLSISGNYYTITAGEAKVTFGNVNNAYKDELVAGEGLEITVTVMGYNSKTLTYVCGSVVLPQLSDADKVANAKSYIASLEWDGKEDLPTEYKGVTIVWSGSDAVSADGKVTLGDVASEVTLTATLTCGEATDTATVSGTIPALPQVSGPLSAPVVLEVPAGSGQNNDIAEGASYGNGITGTEVAKICGNTGSDMLLADGTAADKNTGIKFGSNSAAGKVTLTGFSGYFNKISFLAASWSNSTATEFTFTATCTDGETLVKTVSVTSTTAKALLADAFTVEFEKDVVSVVITAKNRGYLSQVEFSYVAPQA